MDADGNNAILLVDDNPADVELTLEALKGVPEAGRVWVVGDGEEAIEFLRRTGRWTQAPRPYLVLLDLNLPKKNGWEVLEEINEDGDLSLIPVVVVTSSDSERDIQASRQLNAKGYLTKPMALDGYLDMVKSVTTFWMGELKLSAGGSR